MSSRPSSRRHKMTPRSPPRTSNLGSIQTRINLFTYALSRLPPRQLPLLGLYSYAVVYACDRGWITKEGTGRAGAAVVGVLSMVTGLLLSYSFSNAVSKWENGKKVWVEVRTTVRDGVRSISITSPTPCSPATAPASSDTTSSADDLGDLSDVEVSRSNPGDESKKDTDDEALGSTTDGPVTRSANRGSRPSNSPDTSNGATGARPTVTPTPTPSRDTCLEERVHELTGLLVGFAFALQHHLHNTRPLPQPPLCDLLPPAYLSSLKRTEARVRFADHPDSAAEQREGSVTASPVSPTPDPFRPGLKRRGTGPTTRAQRRNNPSIEDDWDISTLSTSATSVLSTVSTGTSSTHEDRTLRQQLGQLNIPRTPSPVLSSEKSYSYGLRTPTPSTSPYPSYSGDTVGTTPGKKSNLTAPNPPNLPLSLLRLMEAYIIGLAGVPPEKGGWSEPKRDRVLAEVKALSSKLGEAERLSANPPPLPLSLHLAHLLLIYLAALPCSLLCTASGPVVVLITMIAGWCLLGLEALVGEVGGVFGVSENHHPLQEFAQQILIESLEINPAFMRYYRSRLVSRLGQDDIEVLELDKRFRRAGEEWMPSFT